MTWLTKTCPKHSWGNHSNKTLRHHGCLLKEIVHFCASECLSCVPLWWIDLTIHWFLVRLHEVTVLGLRQTSPWAVDGPPSSNPSWRSCPESSDYPSLQPSNCIAGHGSGRGSETGIDRPPSIFSQVTLGVAKRGTSPEDFSDCACSPRWAIHSSTSVQSQTPALKNQYLHILHTWPTGKYYGNICMEKSMQSTIHYFQSMSTAVTAIVKQTSWN